MATSILLSRLDAAKKFLLDSQDEDVADSAAAIIKVGLTERLARHVHSLFDEGIKDLGGFGYSPEQQMMAMELKSELEWLLFDIDDFTDEDFKNETADIIPNEGHLSVYYVLLLSTLQKNE